MRHSLHLAILLLIIPILSIAQDSKLYQFLKSIPGAEVKKADSSAWEEFYVLMLPQPLDHKNPGGKTFKQRIFVGHRGFDRPVVMETEGYGAEWMNGFLINEPATLLNANQLYVEHRFFGASAPDKLEWKYLTAEQDAADYHAIRSLFGKIYSGKWITTGVSKGGQTAVAYKVFYPDDVDATIPYVAPLNYKRLDGRINRHFKTVGTEACRKHITRIQEYLLKNKKQTVPIYESICKKQGYTFKIMDAESAFDYSVLEFPFSFWQYTADCAVLPDETTTDADKMVRLLIRIVNPYWYTESADDFAPANYQFYTQLGYYEYNEWPFRKYLKHKDYPNSAFVPKDSGAQWDGSYIRKMKDFMQSDPDRLIFIYGESDPWGATAAVLKPGSRSLKMILEDGTHGATIRGLDKTQQETVVRKLEEWLGEKIVLPLQTN
jgi:hypothetical protein